METFVRSGLIEKGALVDALNSRQRGFAAVDVYDKEPVGTDEPLIQMANVTARRISAT